ncbi:hypothetical protein ACFQ3R_11980 [Mesonia ostreae]|uniref:Esterase n=1 Tax=Mesonia ostreae TaxID=861110 RepID=A0ABU2KIE6_9FLAO|nr:hypothetical protein [Mesonia ostreae]MDT0294486.1 hypothetical protein [Mesonia ostreae]
MKNYILILLLIVVATGYSQDYEKNFQVADSLVYAKTDTIANARKGYELYRELYVEVPEKVSFWHVFDMAYAANKFNDPETGFYWLNKLVDEKYKEEDLSVIFKYAKDDFYQLQEAPKWGIFQEKAERKIKAYQTKLKSQQEKWMQKGLGSANYASLSDGKDLYHAIRDFEDYPNLPSAVFGFIQLNDTLDNNFFVRLPKSYNPKQPSKLLFFLNGAVRHQQIPAYPNTSLEEGWQRFYKQYAEENNVIMVYPNSNKKFNWMLGDQGFGMVTDILKTIKQFINIDDDAVFVTGHSNGATGSFNLLVKNPSAFAGFYGMNTEPKVYTGGTFLKNMNERWFYNISTDEDYYFPPKANDTLVKLAKKLGLNYDDHRYNGFPHWFPQFPESEESIKNSFKDLKSQKRNSFSNHLYWETDDVKNGKIDWLAIKKLDTLQPKKQWHQEVNFTIHEKKYYDEQDSLRTKKVKERAFDFPRKSGAVKANYKDNVFRLKTSRVSELSIFISPEMVNMNQPISIYVNGELRYQKKPTYNRDFILKNFKKTYDRKAIWVQEVRLEL